jgi:hypothetical protein
MANPPPPYDDLTGISRTVMKDNAQETVTNYNGNARPAEMTVNINTNEIYIGNATGALTKGNTGHRCKHFFRQCSHSKLALVDLKPCILIRLRAK